MSSHKMAPIESVPFTPATKEKRVDEDSSKSTPTLKENGTKQIVAETLTHEGSLAHRDVSEYGQTSTEIKTHDPAVSLTRPRLCQQKYSHKSETISVSQTTSTDERHLSAPQPKRRYNSKSSKKSSGKVSKDAGVADVIDKVSSAWTHNVESFASYPSAWSSDVTILKGSKYMFSKHHMFPSTFTGNELREVKHDKSYICMVAFTSVVFISCFVTDMASAYVGGVHGHTSIYEEYVLAIPFSGDDCIFIMFANFVVQAGAILYLIGTLFRKTQDGQKLYLSPRTLGLWFFAPYTISFILQVSWARVFEGEDFIWSTVICLFWLVDVVIAMAHCMIGYQSSDFFNQKPIRSFDKCFVRFFLSNGLAMYAAWVAIKLLQNLSICLKNQLAEDAGKTPTFIFLSLLSAFIIVTTFLELKCFDLHMRYVILHHFVFINSMVSIMADMHAIYGGFPEYDVLVFSSLVVTLAIAMSFVKSGSTIVRHHRNFLSDGTHCFSLSASLSSFNDDEYHQHNEIYK